MTTLAKAEPPADPSEYVGIMVYLDSFNDQLTRAAIEMIGVGRKMGDKSGQKVIGVVIGSNVQAMVNEAGTYGCDEVYGFRSPEFKMYRSKPFTDILANIVFEKKPNILIVPGTKNGRDLAARTAVRVRSGITADCMEIDIEPDTGILIARRPDYGDSTMSEIRCEKHRPQMATSRPGTFDLPARDPKRQFKHEIRDAEIEKGSLKEEIVSFIPRGGEDITASKVIVAGGLGIGRPEGLDLLRQLARELGGSIGVSRPIADLGWAPRDLQIGQTGKIVRPDLYIAAGISGKPQHIVGMMDSKLIISINKDPNAEIFKYSDYAIVGDLYDVIPKLIQVVRKKKEAMVPRPSPS
ncbi:MAG: electron transfer flavoprotein subunit alpha/FixB family protein [Thermoplasmataceae archaeon]